MSVEVLPQQQEKPTDSQFLNRFVSYPSVSSIYKTAVSYYNNAKDSSSIVKMGLETVENNVQSTYQYISPKIINSEIAKKYGPAVDDFGCRQLDKIEKQVESTKQVVSTIKTKASDIAETSKQVIEDKIHLLESKIVPVDSYLKESVIAMPINVALDVTEKVCDRYLPETPEPEKKKVDEKTKEQTNNAGPIIRTTTLSKRLQKRAFSKLHDLRLRSNEKLKSMTHVVDLIQYATENLDAGVKKTNKIIGDSYQMGKDVSTASVKYIKEAPSKIVENPKVKQVKEKVNVLTTEAVHALHLAIETLSKQIPEPITTTSINTYNSLVQKTKNFSASLENSNLQLFNSIASKGSERLKEAASLISSFQSKDQVPSSIVASVSNTLSGVMESLAAVLKREDHESNSDQNSDVPMTSSENKTDGETAKPNAQ